jgi:hypothetical protein
MHLFSSSPALTHSLTHSLTLTLMTIEGFKIHCICSDDDQKSNKDKRAKDCL